MTEKDVRTYVAGMGMAQTYDQAMKQERLVWRRALEEIAAGEANAAGARRAVALATEALGTLKYTQREQDDTQP
jgi:hypothetical protein